MKKSCIWIMVLGLIFGNIYFSYAQPTGNASPQTVVVNITNQVSNITFPFKTRDLIVSNMDSTDYIFVDPISASNTTDLSKCYIVGPGDELLLYNFITEGISILWSNQYTGGEASPISVIATY